MTTPKGRGLFKERPDERIKLKPTARQIRWLRFINLHGPLPSQYFFDLEGEKDDAQRRAAQHQLKRLWQGGFIYRPRQQRATDNANYHHYVYDLTEDGKEFLVANKLWVDALRPTGNFVHQLFISTVTATMDIMCQRNGYRFIPAHEYLNGKPLSVNVTFPWHDGRAYTKPLIPDSVFAIDYGDESYIAFALEADRDTEISKSSRKSPDIKTDERSLKQYITFIGDKQYTKDYEREAQMVLLYVTVNQTKASRFLKMVEEEKRFPFIAVNVVEEFETPYKPPVLLTHLFENWRRAGRPDFTIKKPAS